MRNLLMLPLVAAALSATPALAQGRHQSLRNLDMDRAGALLANPHVQDGVVAMIDQFADALLQAHVGPMALLTDPRADVRPEDTVGDVVRRDDPEFDRRLHDNTRRSLAVTGQALRGAGAMTRELQATTARLKAVLRQYDRGGDRRDYRDDYRGD